MADAIPPQVADAYANSPSPQRETMYAMRRRILAVVPHATEVIKYGMPTFVVDGHAIAGLLAHTKHVGYYPYSGSLLDRVPEVRATYRTTKSAIHVPIDAPLGADLIRTLVTQRLTDATD